MNRSCTRPRDVVLYDGRCGVCVAQVQFLRRLDWLDRLELLSCHEQVARRRFPQLPLDQLIVEMHVVSPSAEVYRGADALRRLCGRLPALWPLVPLVRLPGVMPLARSLYRWFAPRRYRWSRALSCSTEACRRHGSSPTL